MVEQDVKFLCKNANSVGEVITITPELNINLQNTSSTSDQPVKSDSPSISNTQSKTLASDITPQIEKDPLKGLETKRNKGVKESLQWSDRIRKPSAYIK